MSSNSRGWSRGNSGSSSGSGRLKSAASASGSSPARPLSIDAPLDPDEGAQVDALLGVRGQAVAKELTAKVEAALLGRIIQQAQRGEFDAADLLAFVAAFSTDEIRKRVKILTPEAIGLGRRAEQRSQATEASGAFYSTMLDLDVCEVCAELQAREFVPGSPEFEDAYPPLRSSRYGTCQGEAHGNGCRCDMILTFDEQPPTVDG